MRKGDDMKKRKEKGSLTVETALFLTLFIVFFVSMMNLVNVIRAQSVLQYAVDQTAKEISQYSYIFTKTGVVAASNRTYVKAKGFTDDVNSIANDVTQISGAISEGATTGDIASSMATITDASQNMSDTLEGYFQNPESIFAGVLAVGKNQIQGAAKTAVIGGITRSRLKTHLAANGSGPDERLRKMGVVNGINGIDFSESEWFSSGNQDLIIVAKYKMKIKYMFMEVELPEFRVCAATRIW